MPLETGDYISDLVETNPPGTDPVSQGDDHLRLIKHVLKTTFPNINGPVNITDEDMNTLPVPTAVTDAYNCGWTLSTSVPLVPNSLTKCLFDTVDYDTPGGQLVTDGEFLCVQDGLYVGTGLITGGIFTPDATFDMILYKNNAQFRALCGGNAVKTDYLSYAFAFQAPLVAGDILDIRGRVEQGGLSFTPGCHWQMSLSSVNEPAP